MPDERERIETEQHLKDCESRLFRIETYLHDVRKTLSRLHGDSTTASRAYTYLEKLAALQSVTETVTGCLIQQARHDLTYED